MIGTADFEAFLDDISRCFLDRDFDLWRSRLVLPFSVVTKTGPVVLRTDGDVLKNFTLYLKACDIMKLDLVDRHIVSLEDCADGTWLGTYETRLISDGQLATDAYTSTALLQLQDGVLKMSSILNGRGHSEWTEDHDN